MIDTSQLFNCSLFNGIYLLFIFAILLMPSESGNKSRSQNKPWKYFSLFKIWLLTLPFKNYPNKQTVREIQGVQRNMTVGEWFWMSFSIYYIRYYRLFSVYFVNKLFFKYMLLWNQFYIKWLPCYISYYSLLYQRT